MSENTLLTGPEVAALAHILPSSLRTYVRRGYAPEADGPRDASTGWRPSWKRATVENWLANRPGQGKRTDRDRGRADERQRLEQERVAPAPAPQPGLNEWLAGQHAELLAVADVLVDHRDALLELTTDPDGLAEAIDAAGAAMSRRPSKALASGVTYALSVIRRTVRGADPELVRWLDLRWDLHEQFALWAGPGHA